MGRCREDCFNILGFSREVQVGKVGRLLNDRRGQARDGLAYPLTGSGIGKEDLSGILCDVFNPSSLCIPLLEGDASGL